ncbi:MAG TPA: ABC transporter permease [Methanothrix sp.]|jgi:peptide/nickel transport system permease protein|uniref:ABC transporter permease n=1 Tax=Methanothrix sp. TaxID=90426 RepID=UPI002CBF83BA|nr:ABC transporter permease [Methanothrix sp.]
MHIDIRHEIRHDRMALLGILVLALILLMAVFAPLLTPYSPTEYTGRIFNPPSMDHFFGTDSMGQDIWARLLFGARTSLLVAVSVALIASSLSVLIGASSALVGGLYERFWMRAVDVMISLPTIIVMILIAAYFRPSLPLLILLISVFSWPGGARIVRSQVLTLKERMHIYAARTFGADQRHILKNHIVPDISPIIASMMIQDARRAVFMEAGLAFLGVSDPQIISWGKMMHQALAFTYLDVWKWWLLPTGILLSLTLVSLSFLGVGLEAAVDPRLCRHEHEQGYDHEHGCDREQGYDHERGVDQNDILDQEDEIGLYEMEQYEIEAHENENAVLMEAERC